MTTQANVPTRRPSPAVGVTIAAFALLVSCSHLMGSKASAIQSGALPGRMYAGGATCTGAPHFLVHEYNADFFVLRQPACTNYEKPFVYLLFGDKRALLLDTGAGGIDVAAEVDRVVQSWRAQHGNREIELVVAHSHGHGDHVAGDSLFRGKANVTLVEKDTASVRAFFGIANWPTDRGAVDLGGRVIDVIPIPGHQPASIALYDRRTGVLLTGDTFYPGRLYVRDTAAFANSVHRLREFADQHRVVTLLGTHIENTSTPGKDYVVGTKDQPDEHVLPLTVAQLRTLDSAVSSMRGHFARTVLPHFTIWPQ